MTNNDLLSDEILVKAFERLVDQPGLGDKFGWWLLRPDSEEKWFRFEYGYCLNQVYDGRYQVLAEIRGQDCTQVDLAVVRPEWYAEFSPSLVDENKIEGRIELKVNGNWYKANNGLSEDATKVENYTVPSVALCFWILVKLSPQAPEEKYRVISQQIKNGIGTSDYSVIDNLMEKCHAQMLGERPVKCCDDDFSEIKMRLYAYRNKHARAVK